ncbi:MAG: tyrosine--tRNA ligase [Alphaproteobacteria bacterium]
MTNYKSDFLKVMDERGYLNQVTDTDALDDKASSGILTAYMGFDCTATSLHAGSMMAIMAMRRLQQAGHKPIILLGGGTTRIGDPSGKDSARQILTPEKIEENKAGIRKNFENLISFGDGPTDAVLVDNADWLLNLNYIDLLRDVGKHFSINRMLTFESVKQRLERDQPLSFLEFNYIILQSYDFVELNKRFGCTLQMGGSDQWGNIVSGIDLGRRMTGADLYGLTIPLLTTSTGAKMGKTAEGAVWMNGDMLAPYDFWQYWRNADDADVGRFLRLLTDMPMDEISRLEGLEGAEINDAKKILANEITALVHGRDAAKAAEQTAQKTFEQGTIGDDLPRISVGADRLSSGINILDALVETGLAKSKGEARRLIKQNGAKLNDGPIADDQVTVADADVNDGVVKLSVGKKRHALIEA